jgi:hypothetical protein
VRVGRAVELIPLADRFAGQRITIASEQLTAISLVYPAKSGRPDLNRRPHRPELGEKDASLQQIRANGQVQW